MADKNTTTASPKDVDVSQQDFFYVPRNKDKRKRWCESFLNFVDSYSVNDITKARRLKYYQYYNLYYGKFDINDYQYVWGTFGGIKPMNFGKMYPLLPPLIDTVVGKFLMQDNNDSFPFNAYKVNPDAASQKSRKEAEMLFLKMAKPIWSKIEQATGAKLNIDQRAEMLPDDIKKYVKYDMRDMQEQTVYDGIKYIIAKHDIKSEMANALWDELVLGDMYGKIEYVDGDAISVRKDPRTIITDIGIDNFAAFKVLNQGWQFCFEENYYPLNQVLYKYEYWMTEEQIDHLRQVVQSFNQYQGAPPTWINNSVAGVDYYKYDTYGVNIRVLEGQWLARNTREFPKDYNEETGEVKSSELDIMDVYEGVKIGNDIYCKMQRKKNILRTGDNYRKAQLDYFGITSKFSIYDKALPLQMLYQIVMTHFEFAINQAGGTAFEYDVANLPTIGGKKYDINDIIYAAKVQGIIPIQRQEGLPEGGRQSSIGNKVDFGVSNSIVNLFQLKTMIEQTASRMTGVSPDAMGFAKPYQTNGVTESNLENSATAIQPIYYVHSKYVEMGLQKMADLLKVIWDKNETRAYPLGDMGMAMLHIDKDMPLSDYGIFMQNNMKNAQDKDFMMKTLAPAMNVDPTMALELMKMYFSGSTVEAITIFEKAIDSMRQLQAMKAQQAQSIAQGVEQRKEAELQQKDKAVQQKTKTDFARTKYNADANVKRTEIETEGKKDIQDGKNKGTLAHQQLKDANADSMQNDQHNHEIIQKSMDLDNQNQGDNTPQNQ